MYISTRIVAVGIAGIFAMGLLSAQPVTANPYKYQTNKSTWRSHSSQSRLNALHHRYHRRQTAHQTVSTRNYHRTDMNLVRQYGSYPNIQYYQQNGHVYYRDLNTGQNYLVKW